MRMSDRDLLMYLLGTTEAVIRHMGTSSTAYHALKNSVQTVKEQMANGGNHESVVSQVKRQGGSIVDLSQERRYEPQRDT